MQEQNPILFYPKTWYLHVCTIECIVHYGPAFSSLDVCELFVIAEHPDQVREVVIEIFGNHHLFKWLQEPEYIAQVINSHIDTPIILNLSSYVYD